MTALSREDAIAMGRRCGVDVAEQLDAKRAQPYVGKGGAPKGKGRAKYGNSRTYSELIGLTFDSKWESTCANRLWRRQLAGDISELIFQVRICLCGCVNMRPDFQYVEDGVLVTHEAKGMETPKYVLQRKLWSVAGPTRYIVEYQSKPNLDITPCPTPELVRLVLARIKKDGGGRVTISTMLARWEGEE